MEKTIIVTGASRGIGRATAEYFASQGWQVAINYYKSEAAAKELQSSIEKKGGKAFTIYADIGNCDDVKRMIDLAYDKWGRIDALVNNAAIDEMALFQELPIEKERRLFDVNLFGAMNAARFAVPYMLKEKSGSIVNISSVWGRIGASIEVQYSTSKAALIGFTKALSKELAPSGISVNCVAPGVIDTDMNNNVSPCDMKDFVASVPVGRMGTPKEVAKCVYFLATSSYVTGQVLGVDGGYV